MAEVIKKTVREKQAKLEELVTRNTQGYRTVFKQGETMSLKGRKFTVSEVTPNGISLVLA